MRCRALLVIKNIHIVETKIDCKILQKTHDSKMVNEIHC